MGTLQSTLSLSLPLLLFLRSVFLSPSASWFPPTSEIPAEGQRTSSFVLRPSCERKKEKEKEKEIGVRSTRFDGIVGSVAGSTDWRKPLNTGDRSLLYRANLFERAFFNSILTKRLASPPSLHHRLALEGNGNGRSERGVEEGGREEQFITGRIGGVTVIR